MRILAKKWLERDSPVYRLARWTFQRLLRLSDAVRPMKQRDLSANSIFEAEEELSMCSLFPKEIIDLTCQKLAPRTLLDVGCGTGVSLDYFRSKGVQVFGVEGSALALQHVAKGIPTQQHDLHQPLNLGRQFDLVWCFEVAEHIHPDFADTLVGSLARHGQTILVSAARPGQGGLGHLNEQEPPYWIGKFEAAGFRYDGTTAAEFHALEARDIAFAGNLLLFRRAKP